MSGSPAARPVRVESPAGSGDSARQGFQESLPLVANSPLCKNPVSATLAVTKLLRSQWRNLLVLVVLLLTAGLPLVGFLGFVVYTTIFVAPLGPHAYGPGVNIGWPPRAAFWTYMVWLITLPWQAIKVGTQATSGARPNTNT